MIAFQAEMVLKIDEVAAAKALIRFHGGLS
jgi:hypothetical protein